MQFFTQLFGPGHGQRDFAHLFFQQSKTAGARNRATRRFRLVLVKLRVQRLNRIHHEFAQIANALRPQPRPPDGQVYIVTRACRPDVRIERESLIAPRFLPPC